MLLKETEFLDSSFRPFRADIRLSGGKVTEIGLLSPLAHEVVIRADNGLVIPGLNDHHVHLVSYAASLNSVKCGPPEVSSPEDLIITLNQVPGSDWLRGIGFHESVCSGMDRAWLDQHGPARPIRIQHRSGRLWVLNSLGLELIRERAEALTGHERRRLSETSGRLYDVDELINNLTRSEPPPVMAASQKLATFGVTGLNDMTPANDTASLTWFSDLQAENKLLQKVMMSGRPGLSDCRFSNRLALGSTKVHLHDNDLPDFSELVDLITISQRQSRSVAVHCVTEVALVFTLSAMRAAGTNAGNRIEHASVIPPQLIPQLQELELAVVTQPNFVREKGDSYLKEIPVSEHDYLYRCRSLIDAAVPLAFGTDLPFGEPDPWSAIQSATNRQTLQREILNSKERITPEQALTGFLGALESPFEARQIRIGADADLCLLDAPWQQIRSDLDCRHVKLTIAQGEIIYSRD